MREAIISRLAEINKISSFSNKSRYGSVALVAGKRTPLNEIVFSDLTDHELVVVFEHVIYRFYTQM